MTLDTPLGAGAEFDRIRGFAARWRERAHGLGDDCAFIQSGGDVLAVSLDLSVENVHFRRDWMTPAEIGYRAASAALSDLAAVAAAALALLLALGAPAREPTATLDGLADGVGDACADAGAFIVGGDLSRADAVIIDCCVIGRATAAVRRRGARPGDRIVVTGQLGGPLAALTAWRRGGEPPPAARQRFVRPAPRHEAARFLAQHRARAMVDISDGLAADLGHLLAASDVAAHVRCEAIPVHPDAPAVARELGEEPWWFAARSGEEYELLAALPDTVTDAELAAAPVPLTVIGTIAAGRGLRATLDGAPARLPPGHDHFAAG
jgi:thiamine-monophosphate kinase